MLQAIDFFAGAGGMSHGLLQAGIDVIAGVDSHRPCKWTYENPRNNLRRAGRPPTFVHSDISSSDVIERISALGVGHEDDTMIFVGCSPCQFWSKINTSRERSATTRSLLGHFQELVKVFRPGYVLIENVPGLNSRRDESGLIKFLRFLSQDGYGFDESVVAAYQYGVPQKRYRYVLVGTRLTRPGHRAAIELPAPTQDDGGYPEGMNVRDFLGEANGFLPLRAGERRDEPPLHWASALSETNLRRIRMTPADGGTRAGWKSHPALQIDAYRGKDNYFRDVYGRMRWDEPAPTITTRFNSLSNGRFGHPVEDRAISLREGATLQTFPRHYEFPESFPEAARQIGNAVPPALAQRLGRQLVEHYSITVTE